MVHPDAVAPCCDSNAGTRMLGLSSHTIFPERDLPSASTVLSKSRFVDAAICSRVVLHGRATVCLPARVTMCRMGTLRSTHHSAAAQPGQPGFRRRRGQPSARWSKAAMCARVT